MNRNRIPKIIHYCWFGHSKLPDMAVRCIASWRKFFPDYEIRQWDESNFDVNVCDYAREACEKRSWAFLSDYARFWIIYNYGGLYFDTDVEVIRPMDDIIERGPFMGLEMELDFSLAADWDAEDAGKFLSVAPGLGLAANPGLGLYREILDDYEHSHFAGDYGASNITTVVKRVSSIILRHKIEIADKNSLCVEGIYIYKKDFFSPKSFQTGETQITENTRSIHHYAASWITWPVKCMGRIDRFFARYGGRYTRWLAVLLRSPFRFINRWQDIGFLNAAKLLLLRTREGSRDA